MNTKPIIKAAKVAERLNEEYDDCTLSDAVKDILTDIRHFCDQRSVDFFTALRRSGDYHAAERDGDG